MKLFVSYARSDRPKVDPLAQQLRQAGNDVWVDTDLVGGQVWWDKILDQLRQCDALVAIVSRSSLNSEACRTERHYARNLGKSVLPLTVERLDATLLPNDLAQLQVLDYSQPSEANAFKLIGAIARLRPPQPLPDPLPEPPTVPPSYWDPIPDLLSVRVLSQDQQLAIIGRLEGAFAPMADPSQRPTALELLGRLEARPDLYVLVDRRIAALRASLPKPADQQQDAPPQHHTPTQDAPPQHIPAQDAPRQNTLRHPQPPLSAPIPAAVSPHWGMAIWALILCWPTGIPAVVYAARVNPRLGVGDLVSAQASSSRVKTFFWISLVVFVLFWIIAIAASASNNSQNTGALIGRAFA